MVADVIYYLFLVVGNMIMISGTIGVIRFPDVYTRLHASTKCDTGGAMSIIIAMFLSIEAPLAIRLKLLVLAFLIALINPMIAHAIARGAHKYGIKPVGMVDAYVRDRV
ncbi:MAG: monovalent cation/H(+) antiporter subunit G [Candidatus Natronoplasma sp.]